MQNIAQGSPCVVLASPGFMDSGSSRELLELWAPDPRNGLVITGYSIEGTLAKVSGDRSRTMVVVAVRTCILLVTQRKLVDSVRVTDLIHCSAESSQRARGNPVVEGWTNAAQDLNRQCIVQCPRRLLAELGIHRTRRPRACGK